MGSRSARPWLGNARLARENPGARRGAHGLLRQGILAGRAQAKMREHSRDLEIDPGEGHASSFDRSQGAS